MDAYECWRATSLAIRLAVGAIVFGAVLSFQGAADAGLAPQQRCVLGQSKTTGQYALCKSLALARYVVSGDLQRYELAYAKCSTKSSTNWEKLRQAVGGAGFGLCPAEWDIVKAQADSFISRLVPQIIGARFVNNNDGTVTDTQTGLQWEQKTTAVGSGSNSEDPHDVDNTYTWNTGTPTGNAYSPDGTAFTDFLAKLNGAEGGACFADKCDWRIPIKTELLSLLLASFPCGTSPCIDPIFGPTRPSYYWAATTFQFDPYDAWLVNFEHGEDTISYKVLAFYVRAVRGGSGAPPQ